MNMERQAEVTQPVRTAREGEEEFLLFTGVGERVLSEMKHMEPVLECLREECVMSGGKQRLLLLAEDAMLARQAALVCMNGYVEWQGCRKRGSREKEELYAQLDQLFEPYTKEKAVSDVDWETDFLILRPEDLTDKKPELPVGLGAVLLQPAGESGKKGQEALELAHHIYVDCFDGALSDALVDELAILEKDVMVLAAPKQREMTYYLKRLSFEQGFRIIPVRRPGQEYYADLLGRYLRRSGAEPSKELRLAELVQRLKSYRGALFCEQDIFRMADVALARAGREKLELEHFHFYGDGERKGLEKLERLIGLDGVKKSIRAAAAMQQMQAEQGLGDLVLHRNLAFAGPPGTGKSVVAALYGEILAELGISNGKFISASRRDLIGQYLGHTAEKMYALFRRAKGGVLFIDEAGGLTTQDEFTRECVTELVRYMEEQPETTVIFASYPLEMDALLKSDPGLSSRIQKVIRFEEYQDRELLEILRLMAEEAGFGLSGDVEAAVYEYIRVCRACRGKQFGNAREMRRLLELAMESYSVRTRMRQEDRVLLGSDIDAVRAGLLSSRLQGAVIGFGRS